MASMPSLVGMPVPICIHLQNSLELTGGRFLFHICTVCLAWKRSQSCQMSITKGCLHSYFNSIQVMHQCQLRQMQGQGRWLHLRLLHLLPVLPPGQNAGVGLGVDLIVVQADAVQAGAGSQTGAVHASAVQAVPVHASAVHTGAVQVAVTVAALVGQANAAQAGAHPLMVVPTDTLDAIAVAVLVGQADAVQAGAGLGLDLHDAETGLDLRLEEQVAEVVLQVYRASSAEASDF